MTSKKIELFIVIAMKTWNLNSRDTIDVSNNEIEIREIYFYFEWKM
jgi:hypothetical protein